MIPKNFIEQWHPHVKWQTPAMVEQDLVISRALICLYNDPKIKDSLVFRGGTALNKLFLKPPTRYSEDIDFVQRTAAPIGETINAIREVLKSWLGEPKRKLTERGAKLIYQYETIDGQSAKLKIEINTTEHFQVLPLRFEPFSLNSKWFSGECVIPTYELEELMGTKLRALYQRKKGRDLFDVWHVFSNKLANIEQTIEIFQKYCAHNNTPISKDLFHKNMDLKRLHSSFQVDMSALLPDQKRWDFNEAFEFVQKQVISKLP